MGGESGCSAASACRWCAETGVDDDGPRRKKMKPMARTPARIKVTGPDRRKERATAMVADRTNVVSQGEEDEIFEFTRRWMD